LRGPRRLAYRDGSLKPLSVLTLAAFGLWPGSLCGQLPRGVPGDLVADKVFGKPDFTQVTPYTTVAGRLFIPHGVIVDRTIPTRNILYVYDSGNNRILGVDLSACRLSLTDPLGCTAAIVLGQPSPHTSACNGDSGFQNYPLRAPATASSLCGEDEAQLSISEGGSGASMAVDARGNLYVPDFWNHRVLKYDRPFDTDGVADDVWGQGDFQSNTCNKGMSQPDATSLCFSWGGSNNWTAGVDVDGTGNLWVADSGNNRVLRFPPGSKTADLVLGQPDFTSTDPGTELNESWDPSVVRVSPWTGSVYVAESYNDRVLVFKPPFSNGMAGTPFGSGFGRPQGLDFDPMDPGAIWIDNVDHVTLELWSESSGTLLRTVGVRDGGPIGPGSSGSIGVDSSGSIYIAVLQGSYQNDVLAFDRGVQSDLPPHQLFGPGPNLPTSSDLGWSVEGVVVSDGQLIVADNDRLLYWNNPDSKASGQPADWYAAGAQSFSDFQDSCCGIMAVDKNHHLFVAGSVSSSPSVQVYQLPLTPGALPILTLIPPFPVLGGGATADDEIAWITGIAVSGSGELWLSESAASRTLRLRNPMTSPTVDVILGQLSPAATDCNRGGDPGNDTLCYPSHVALDRRGNVFVSDDALEEQGNFRLLEFSASVLPSGNTAVIYAPAAEKVFESSATWQPTFDSANHMVVGYNAYYNIGLNPEGGWFPGVYGDPLSDQIEPDSYLKDYFSMAYSAFFDENDNLYITDLDRSRVLFYEKPTASLPAITGMEPPAAAAGDPIRVSGRNLSGTTAVSFGDISASFRVDSDTQLTVVVPQGARTGPIHVVSPAGGAVSVADFVIGLVPRHPVEPCCQAPKPKPVAPRRP